MWIRQHICLFLFSLFPQILMVALCNSRAMGEASEDADIDLFIITKKWNLWTVRGIVTVISAIFGIRRRNTYWLIKWTPAYISRTKDRFCLSFFITEEAMDLASIRLLPRDPYLDRWMSTLIPLIDNNNTYERFMEINRVGIHYSKEISGLDFGSPFSLTTSMKNVVRNDGKLSFSSVEKLIKYLWLPKTLRSYEKLGRPWWVVISDTMLKFHVDDVRKERARESQIL